MSRTKVFGISERGATTIITSGVVSDSVPKTINSYPLCTVSVFLNGTSTLATIFSDDNNTPLANPFAADSSANWFFYVGPGRYSIRFSGTGIATPFTVSDVVVPEVDPSTFVDVNYASLSAAVTAIGSTPGTLRITQSAFPNGANCTVPSTLVLEFVGDGYLTVATGQTVIIQSDGSQWPVRKIFYNATAGLGTISYSGSVVLTDVWGAWWGAFPSSTATVNAASLNAANAALVTIGSGEICLGPGIYDFNATVTLGTTGSFTTIGLKGTSGLVGTQLNWTGSTSGVAVIVSLGRFNHVHDIMINNGVAKGTTVGLQIAGTASGGANTFWSHFERITVRGFHINGSIGDGTDESDLLRFDDCAFELGDYNLKITGSEVTNLTFTNTGCTGSTIAGVWVFSASAQISWDGGDFGANLLSFLYQSAGGTIDIRNVRDEFDSADWIFLKSTSASNSSAIHISGLRPASAGPLTLNNPAILAYSGTVEISNCNFQDIPIIPFGTTTADGNGNGPCLSINIHDNLINENVALFQFNTTTSSAFNGMRYKLWNNEKISSAGNPIGHFNDEDGQIAWPDKISRIRIASGYSRTSYTPAQITANTNNYVPLNPSTGLVIPAVDILRLLTDASRDITGLSLSQVDGQQMVIINVGAQNIVLKNDVTSTAANRFLTSTGADITLAPLQEALLIYDAAATPSTAIPANRWRVSKLN